MKLMKRIELRLQELEAASDPAIRESARDLVQALMDFHRPGIGRMMEALPSVADLAREEAVGRLLLLYDLHPESFEARVRDAVSRMAGVELLSLSDGVVRLRARRGMAVEDAIYAAAPDATAVEVESTPELSGFVPLESLLRS